MKKAIVLGAVVALAVVGSVYLTSRTESVAHEDSPAFQALLGEAIARLEGVPQEITSATVGEANAAVPPPPTTFGEPTCTRPECLDYTYDGALTCSVAEPTCDDQYTCERFYTCDSYYTCHGEVTCNGCHTCWFSTCDAPEMTYDGLSYTCDYDNFPECIEYTWQGGYTCDGTYTCGWNLTCVGWPECGGGPSPNQRTTWGQIKSMFTQ